MTAPHTMSALPPHAATVLMHLAKNAAMDAPPFTESELAASMSHQLREHQIKEGLAQLNVRGFLDFDSKTQRLALKLVSSGINVIDPQYINFVESLFKCFYKPVYSDHAIVSGEELDFNATLMHATIGVAGEAGELLDATKKAWVYNKPLDRDNMVEELGDMFFYFVKTMQMLGVSLNDVIKKNQDKLAKRYPQGVYSDQHAQARLDKTT
jgi:NTP pyrophosphatase (non-canonical NTP hydrolase)